MAPQEGAELAVTDAGTNCILPVLPRQLVVVVVVFVFFVFLSRVVLNPA